MTAQSVQLGYSRASQAGEYLKGVLGLGCSLVPLVFLRLNPWLVAIFAGSAALFVGTLLKTATRQMGRMELSEEGLAVSGPFARSLSWDHLAALSLRYYPKSREGTAGWMRLVLRGRSGRSFIFDSDLTGFDALLTRAVRAGLRNAVAFDTTTRANLAAAGRQLPDDTNTDFVPSTRKRDFAA